MKLFSCECEALVFFENTQCIECSRMLGFAPDALSVVSLSDEGGELSSLQTRETYRRCANWIQYDACNWLVRAEDSQAYCVACRLNEIVPDLSNKTHLALWKRMEAAKRRLVYSLLSLSLPVTEAGPGPALSFQFLADSELGTGVDGPRVMTGHAAGLITINLAEADEIERAQARQQLGEAYRTLLGHFRHESGHYYWDRFIRDSAQLSEFRELFGDESIDYAQALEQHYAKPPDATYADEFVSAYAASHPWEDWAETWAHYLHSIDGLETAHAFGIQTHAHAQRLVDPTSIPPTASTDFTRTLESWTWLSLAMNGLNRSLGMRDCYPFALSSTVMRKLDFVDRIVRSAATPGAACR
ncbi:MAG: putative zinc-binding metallopeptidase [Polyangiaceae bacterium]